VTTLAADKTRSFEAGYEPCFNHFPVIASDIIYQGAAVGDPATGTGADGYAHPIDASDAFLGFCEKKADNSAGAAGAINVLVRQRGAVKLTVVGVTGTGDIGSTVYLTDDNTFTLASTGGIAMGKMIRHVTSTTAIVFFEGAALRSI
jgi:hypothetical protein